MLPGVASIGVRPTVEDAGRVLLEVHLFDFSSENLYGKLVRVEFMKKLRDEARFDTPEALTAAIAKDTLDARAFFGLIRPPGGALGRPGPARLSPPPPQTELASGRRSTRCSGSRDPPRRTPLTNGAPAIPTRRAQPKSARESNMSDEKRAKPEKSKYPVNLLDTPFPMRGDLPKREPQWVKQWQEQAALQEDPRRAQGREEVRAARRPPVCQRRHPHRPRREQGPQGHDHQGARAGRAATPCYVPGWDCHGMPIEIQIEKKFGKGLPVQEVQAKARAYATEQIARQKKDFERLGVLGDWDQPVPDHELQQRSRRAARAGQDHGKGLRVPRPEAGELVFRLRFGAGRGRGRVQGQDRPVHRRGLPVRGGG